MAATQSPTIPSGSIKLTYDDYQVLPDDGNRYEILTGDLFVTPAPTPRHQSISKEIEFYLITCLEKYGMGRVFHAPIDVVFADNTIAQPDILFIAQERFSIIGECFIQGAPDLIIEILSPSTRRRDIRIKSALYAQFNVPHYWIVDPDLECIELFQLKEQRYVSIAKFSKPDILVSETFPRLRIPLAEVFK
jgi:Uma2 family endonuclease